MLVAKTISQMIQTHDAALKGKQKVDKSLKFVGLKLNEKDLAKEVAMDLNLPSELTLLIINQIVRRIVYHMVHGHELTFNYFGRFHLKRGQRHWVIQFTRMRSLDSYLNARLDNDMNKKSIVKINPLINHSWYERETVRRDTNKVTSIRPSEKMV